jgi:hypothetical protein
MTHLNKTLAALGMALFFTFGAFAVSLAYDSVPVGPLYALELHPLSATGPAQLYAPVLTSAYQFESGDVPEGTRPCSGGYPFRHFDTLESLTPFNSAQVHTAKVSLQILQSALLL